ncbi:MAG TPA: FkbM family methyltransferase [Candidatus Saccharimonadia bacterium]|nr:FkbM family methyltransferase [Candidatus Saccharimonadia bacterium]
MKFVDYDRKMQKILAAPEPYQGDRLARALPFCRQRRHALDVGANIGLWTIQLVAVFEWITAFEPHPDSVIALRENVINRPSVKVSSVAIGNLNGIAYLDNLKHPFGSHISPADVRGEVEIDMRTLDDFKLTQVDFIKIDVEGFETFVVEGGEETIRRDRPVIVVEQKHESRYGLEQRATVTMLEKWGATVEWKIKHDFCMRWK